MESRKNKVFMLVSLAASALLVAAAFAVVWLAPRGAAPASAQTGEGTTKPSTITVRGSGTISARPNTLVMIVGVSEQGNTVKLAQDKASAIVGAMVEKLKAAGIADADYRTLHYNVETVMDYEVKGNPNAAPKVTGFRVTNMLEITFRDPARAPQVLDDLVAAGANTIYSSGYTFANLEELQKQAYDKAVKDAEERASRLASLSGLTLGKVVSVTEASATSPIAPYGYGKDMGAGGGAFYPGQSNVGIDVIVTYEAK